MPVTPYATQAELAARVAPEYLAMIADDNHDAVHDEIILTSALERATALINHFLAGRYRTPLDAAPDVIRLWCIDLAAADLFERRREALPAELGERAGLALRALRSIADGLNSLAGAEPAVVDFKAASTRPGRPAAFTPDRLNLY